MTMWMDVDLHSSAADLEAAYNKVDRRGAIFSHECSPEHFSDNTVVPGLVTPDNVVPTIVDHFTALKLNLNRQFIFGNTGAFWREDGGIQVLDNQTLLEMIVGFGSSV